ncbi:MAG: BatD family protein [Pseudomonadales bacterium]
MQAATMLNNFLRRAVNMRKQLQRAVSAFGKPCAVGIIFFSLSSAPLWALELRADRDTVPVNETVRVEVRSSGSESLSNIDLAAIEAHFDILGRSSQSEFSMVNGRTEALQKLALTLQPLRPGKAVIAPLAFAGKKSNALTINVVTAVPPPASDADDTVRLEAEVDKQSVYPGEQLLYTLRLMYRIGLSEAEISPLSIPGAQIIELEDASYQRQSGGASYQVVEKRHAVFFNTPGSVHLGGQTLTALAGARRSRFGFGFGLDPQAGGKRIRLAAAPLSIEVLPLPANATAANWLPATEIELRETWSDSNSDAEVGQPLTRSIEIYAVGLPGESLPELVQDNIDALNRYPEKPAFITEPWSGGIAGKRIDTYAYIPTRAGTYTLPALSLTWWNTERNRAETATLPARTFAVKASSAIAASQPNTVPLDNRSATANGREATANGREATANGREATANVQETTATNRDTLADAAAENAPGRNVAAGERTPATDTTWLWQVLSAIALMGWCATALAWRLARHRAPAGSAVEYTLPDKTQFAQVQRALLLSCKNNDSHHARRQLDRWLSLAVQCYLYDAQDRPARDKAQNTASCLQALGDPALAAASRELDSYLFGHNERQSAWQGDKLAAAVKTLRVAHVNNHDEALLPPLYPVSQSRGAAL